MKKYSILFMAVAAFVFAASCNKIEEINTPEPVVETELITVELNPMTKTALGAEGATVWDANDVVSVTVDGKKIGDLKLVEGSKFSGEVEAGYNGVAKLHYPSGITTVPATQKAVANTFADDAALLDGETTMDALRAGEAVKLQNSTSVLKFKVAKAGDVTFEVGSTKYTVTGCKTGLTYYACVTPVSDATFVARIDGYFSKRASKNVTFAASKIANLEDLPAPVECEWGLVGQHQGWNLSKANLTRLYQEKENLFVVKNIKLQNTGFKFTQLTNTNWDLTFGSHSSSYVYKVSDGWYTGIYSNNRGDKANDIKVSDWNNTYDVYLRYVQNASWGKELGFAIVEAGQPCPTF